MGSGRVARFALAAALLAGCLRDNTVYCADGRACPQGTQCEDTLGLCIVPEQLGQCESLMPGAACTFGTDDFGECIGRVCVPPRCGDGLRSGTEECDGDDLAGVTDCTQVEFYQPGPVGCRTDCRFEVKDCHERCGDDVFQPAHEICEPGLSMPAETCIDFGYQFGALACSAFCTPGFLGCKRIGWHRISTVGVELRGAWTAPNGTVFAVGEGMTLEIANGVATSSALPASEVRLRHLRAIWGTSDTDVYAIGDQGAWWHRDASGWTLVHNDPDVLFTNDLLAVWGTSSTNVYAVGATGRVVHYDGTSWTAQTLGTGSARLAAIWGSSASDIYVASQGALYHFNGTGWSPVTGMTDDYRGIWGTAANDVYTVAFDAQTRTVRHFNGTQWSTAFDPASDEQCYSITGTSPSDIYVSCGGSENVIYRFDGVAWARMVLNPLITNLTAGAGDVFAVGNDVYRFAQAAWSAPHPFVNNGPFVSFAVSERGNELALDQYELLRNNKQGAWTQIASPTPFSGSFKSIWSAATKIVIAESLGQVHHYDGQTWTRKSSTLAQIDDLAGFAANDLWAVGPGGIAHFDGTSWTKIDMTPTVAIDGSAANDIFALASPSGVLHYNGTSWTMIAGSPSMQLSDIYAAAPDNVFAVGPGGRVVHYDGSAWTSMASSTSLDLEHITGTSKTDVFATGANLTLVHYDGAAWAPVTSAGTPCGDFASLATRADATFVGCEGSVGTLLRSPTW